MGRVKLEIMGAQWLRLRALRCPGLQGSVIRAASKIAESAWILCMCLSKWLESQKMLVSSGTFRQPGSSGWLLARCAAQLRSGISSRNAHTSRLTLSQ